MGVIRLTFELVVVTAAAIVIIANIPMKPLFDDFRIEPITFETGNLSKYINEIGWNDLLDTKGVLLLKDKVIGPESLVVTKEFIYTGLADGRIIEIDKDSLNFRLITRLAKDATNDCYDFNYWRSEKCGRPLGMRLDATGNLLVVEPAFGLFKVDIKTGRSKLLGLGEKDERPNELRGILNDFVSDPLDSNILYVTVTVRNWTLGRIMWALFERDPTGVVLAFDLRTKKVTKLADRLSGANGIEISADKKYLLVSESGAFRISKLNLEDIRKLIKSGDSRGVKREVFIDELPGEPDNIRLHNGEIYLGVVSSRVQGPSIGDRAAGLPMVRKAVARMLYLSSLVVKYVRNTLYVNPALEEVEFMLSSGHVFYSTMPNSGAICVLDGRTGKFKRILGSNKFSFISEVVIDEFTGDLYFGSFRNRFLGRVNANDLK